MVSTTADVRPGEVAAALRAAGLTEIDTAVRRRAEYSSDASNYRVVPQVVAFPRSADEIVAALAACRELGLPLVARGAGTSIAALSLELFFSTSSSSLSAASIFSFSAASSFSPYSASAFFVLCTSASPSLRALVNSS